MISSKILGENRQFWVYTPRGYDDGYQNYPVLYLLDGESNFYHVTGSLNVLSEGMLDGMSVIPRMIVIGITNENRTKDMTPTHSIKDMEGNEDKYLATSGGGVNFLNFIKNELIPHVDSSFRTMPYRIFAGHSLGGITVINSLYLIPETFNAYIVLDPSLWWDDQILLKKGKEYFLNTKLNSKTLFLGQSASTSLDNSIVEGKSDAIKEYRNCLETRNQSNIKWTYQ